MNHPQQPMPESTPPPEPQFALPLIEEEILEALPAEDDRLPVVVPEGSPDDGIPMVVPVRRRPPVHGDYDDVPEVLEAKRPGPGFWLALGLCVLYLFFQVAFVVFIAAVAGGVLAVQLDDSPSTGGPAAEDLKDNLTEFLADGTGNVLLLLGITTLTVAYAIALALLFQGRNAGRAFALRGVKPLQGLCVLLLVPPGYVIVLTIHYLASQFLPTFQKLEGLETIVRSAYWPLLVVAGCVMPGIGEELLCRGCLGRGLVARHGVILGTLLASFLFGLLHVDPVQVCYAIFLGIVLHFTYLTTKSLLAPMALHFLHNLAAFAIPRLGHDHPESPWSAWMESLEFSPVLLLGALAAEAALILWLYQMRTRWVLPDGSTWSPGYVTAEMPHPGLRARPVGRAASWWSWVLLVVGYAAFVGACCYLMLET